MQCAFNPFVLLWDLSLPFYLFNTVSFSFFCFWKFGIICWIRSDYVYGQAASSLVAGNNLEVAVQQILDMGGGTWDRDTVVRGLRAAYNNPERAIEYLYSVSFLFMRFFIKKFYWGGIVDLLFCYWRIYGTIAGWSFLKVLGGFCLCYKKIQEWASYCPEE